MIEVDQKRRADGKQVFETIGEALAALERNPLLERKICVYSGVYREQLRIRAAGVVIEGVGGAEAVCISGSLGALELLEDGKKRGTFRTYTCMVDAPGVTLRGLTIENTAGPGTKAGQAIALYADGDRLLVENCRLLGWQDTLFTAPLPPKEIEPDGFRGPKQYAPRLHCRQYYRHCYIAGEVDFIFGGAAAWFEECTLFSLDTDRVVRGYVTAPSTPQGEAFGYVFHRCRLESDCPAGTVFLGRPWREWGRSVFLSCYFGAHISRQGWDDWGKKSAHQHGYFAEYCCFGPGAERGQRPDWSHALTDEEANAYTPKKVLGGWIV